MGIFEDRFQYVSELKSMEPVRDGLALLKHHAEFGRSEESSVLIIGECGTEKETIARMIHADSQRAQGPFVVFNCAQLDSHQLEKELFGLDRKGLLETAKNGTLFLDAIENLDVNLQGQLLRVLKQKTFRRMGSSEELNLNVRFVVGTEQNLETQFQNEFYKMIVQMQIHIPPLRERKSDILLIACQFAQRSFRSFGKVFEGFTSEAEKSLNSYSWNGNVAELYHVMERTALTFRGSGLISSQMLSIPTVPTAIHAPALRLVSGFDRSASMQGAQPELLSYTEVKRKWSDSFEKEYLIALLDRHCGNVSAAARESKLDRSNFLRLLRRHKLKGQDYRKAA
jgi:DNA-binding NtrC family response regulator